jgi:hypothetical protein
MEQRINELEIDKRKAASSVSSLRAKEQRLAEMLEASQSDVKALVAELKAVETAKLEAESSQKVLVEELTTALRHSDAEVHSLQITVDNLKQQLDLADQTSFKRWMQEVVLSDDSFQGKTAEPAAEAVVPAAPAASSPGDSGTVKELVVSLLVQWREQTGFYPRGATAAISRAEQRFLQRICDFVMAAHERCEAANAAALLIEEEKAALEERHEVIRRKLALCTEQLNRCGYVMLLLHIACQSRPVMRRSLRRLDASERVITVDKKHALRLNERLVGILRGAVSRSQQKLRDSKQQLLIERQRAIRAGSGKETLVARIKHLQVTPPVAGIYVSSVDLMAADAQTKVAELEAAGSPSVRLREQLTAGVETRARALEESLHKWFKVSRARINTPLVYVDFV